MRFKSHLLRLSRTSEHHRYKHVALIAKGHQIFGVGINTEGHHAEINALFRAGKDSKGATLYTLMTRTRDGSIGNGAPCLLCMEAITQAKIRKVVVYV